jgi:large subunit ribosomal protein L23
MNQERLMHVLLAPHISEKTAMAAESSNQYVFKVARDANKTEIRAAVEKLFEVNVESVRVLNVKGKTKRFKNILGRRPHWKKAYVRLAEGQTIDIAAE